jgi:hypothetical protein
MRRREPATRIERSPEVDQKRLYATTDASAWAEEFAKVVPEVDQGTMVTWFANAIETAKTHERKAVAEETQKERIPYDLQLLLRAVMGELGVPTPDYPANVANAYNLLAERTYGRCTAAYPCVMANQYHLDIWGECFVASSERMVSYGERHTGVAVSDSREVAAQ